MADRNNLNFEDLIFNFAHHLVTVLELNVVKSKMQILNHYL